MKSTSQACGPAMPPRSSPSLLPVLSICLFTPCWPDYLFDFFVREANFSKEQEGSAPPMLLAPRVLPECRMHEGSR